MLVQKFSSHTSKFLSNFSIFVEMAFIQREKDDSCTLPKQMDFTNISQNYLSATADKRNRIPRKSQIEDKDLRSYTSGDFSCFEGV